MHTITPRAANLLKNKTLYTNSNSCSHVSRVEMDQYYNFDFDRKSYYPYYATFIRLNTSI